jgi:adenosine deaminase
MTNEKMANMINSNLPLTDIHRHLDGNIRIQTIIDLGRKYNIELPSFEIEHLTPHVQVIENEPSLVSFLSKLDWGVNVLGDLDACRRVAIENVEDVFRAGIDYAELRFSPYYMALAHQLPLEGVVEAVIDGVMAGSKLYNVPINLIGIMSRTYGQKACERELEALCSYRDNIVAIDLAGDELNYPSELFLDHFKRAKSLGFHITVHAGEAAGSHAIWYAINHLGAERIGHGVKAIEDPKLLDYLAKHQIGIESCLTSNIQTTTVSSYKNHPIKEFLNHGLLVSLNTDDPAVEGIELPYEYQVAAQKAGLTSNDTHLLQKNGLDMSFLSLTEKQNLIAKVAHRT